MSRTKKQPYRKSKAIDPSCRSHGGCPVCLGNRQHANNKRLEAARQGVIDAAKARGNTDIENIQQELIADIQLARALEALFHAESEARHA